MGKCKLCVTANVRENRRNRRDHYERNREEVISRSRKWAENNPERVRIAKANNRRKRRAAKYDGRGNVTAQEFKELCEKYDNRCLRCGDTEAVLEADHVVPLTRGGLETSATSNPYAGTVIGGNSWRSWATGRVKTSPLPTLSAAAHLLRQSPIWADKTGLPVSFAPKTRKLSAAREKKPNPLSGSDLFRIQASAASFEVAGSSA